MTCIPVDNQLARPDTAEVFERPVRSPWNIWKGIMHAPQIRIGFDDVGSIRLGVLPACFLHQWVPATGRNSFKFRNPRGLTGFQIKIKIATSITP